jgi:hypothetical protein
MPEIPFKLKDVGLVSKKMVASAVSFKTVEKKSCALGFMH